MRRDVRASGAPRTSISQCVRGADADPVKGPFSTLTPGLRS